MGTIAIIGDATTTTTMSIAATWTSPVHDRPAGDAKARGRGTRQMRTARRREVPLVVEVDPAGGSLAAWLDMPTGPSLSTIVAQSNAPALDDLEPMIRTSPHGLRIITAPVRSREASRAVAESCHELLPLLADDPRRTVLLDVGRLTPADGVPPTVQGASAIVVCHRQAAASARAAAVRLERLAEAIELLAHLDRPLTVVLIGERPYGGDEVLEYLLSDASRIATPAAVPTLIPVPIDPLGAAVLAGRVGVSPRRLARLPLMRAARTVAAHLGMAPAIAEFSEQHITARTSSRPNGSEA